MPLGTFFVGSSVVSFTVTPWIFPRWGRKRGFLTGIALSLVGTALGAISVKASSPGLYVLSAFFFGMATGLGFALRFAAVELVPPHYASRAVTLVVSGGVIAAFAGPEASAATRDSFGSDLTYMGVFLMTGIFNVCNIVCTMLVTFPDSVAGASESSGEKSPSSMMLSRKDWRQFLTSRSFVIPMLITTCAWASMAMPMSLVRVIMGQVGYSNTESLRVIELHFLGMCEYNYGENIFVYDCDVDLQNT